LSTFVAHLNEMSLLPRYRYRYLLYVQLTHLINIVVEARGKKALKSVEGIN